MRNRRGPLWGARAFRALRPSFVKNERGASYMASLAQPSSEMCKAYGSSVAQEDDNVEVTIAVSRYCERVAADKVAEEFGAESLTAMALSSMPGNPHPKNDTLLRFSVTASQADVFRVQLKEAVEHAPYVHPPLSGVNSGSVSEAERTALLDEPKPGQ